MRIFSRNKRVIKKTDWHFWFAWRPVRINETELIWLERVERQLIVDDEGNWAGGTTTHWEYRV